MRLCRDSCPLLLPRPLSALKLTPSLYGDENFNGVPLASFLHAMTPSLSQTEIEHARLHNLRPIVQDSNNCPLPSGTAVGRSDACRKGIVKIYISGGERKAQVIDVALYLPMYKLQKIVKTHSTIGSASLGIESKI